jgi:predicted ATPase
MNFSSLPVEYQAILEEIEEQHGYQLTPLQTLGGGRTGALLYLVSAAHCDSPGVQHYILKLDRKKPDRRSEEIQRHQHAQENAPDSFARNHMAQLAMTFEHETAAALFYTIAGQSLLRYKALSNFERQDHLETLFRSIHETILKDWNQSATFQAGLHPQKLLEHWLGYRITPRGNLISFFEETLSIPPEAGSLLIGGQVYPNPLAFSRSLDLWGETRPLDTVHGFQHGDLNVANILAHIERQENRPDGLYLIDFALYKAGMPLYYDLAYLEMSYLLEALGRSTIVRWWQFVREFSVSDLLDAKAAAVELAGPAAVINAGRTAFKRWMEKNHPSLQDDLWAQYWLAAVAAGLNFANKPALQIQERKAGLLFACAHLQRYCTEFSIPLSHTAALLDLQPSSPPPAPLHLEKKPAASATSRLPHPPDAFIGRDRELAELKEILLRPDVRLVTMTGPGGTGKTRLALRVAEELQPQFSSGAAFVSLAEVHEPDLLLNRIAGQFGLREGGSLSLTDILFSNLHEQQLLLVLDNFEQIVPAAPHLISLLEAAPGVKLLVTSRILLNLRSEYEYPVPTLSLPNTHDDGMTAAPNKSEAVQLFVTRAQAANRSFSLNDQNAGAVAEICRRLDGLPLAIELAAARIRMLSPEALLVRLNDRLSLLTGGARDLPDRQRTLRGTIDWSFDLLEPDQQRLFTRLGVFVGGFSLEAAEAVCDPDSSLDVFSGIEALLQSSLIRPEESNFQPRFTMLETVHDYAVDHLNKSGEQDLIHQRHAQYYEEILSRLADMNVSFSNEMERWLDWISLEHDNLQAVYDWSKQRPQNFQQVISIILGMSWYWYRRGHLTEGRAWSNWALALPESREVPFIHGLLLCVNGIMALHQSDLQAADELFEQQLQVGYASEDDSIVGIAFIMKGMVMTQRGQHENAYSLLEMARGVSTDINMDWWTVDALLTQTTAALGMNDIDDALKLVQEAEAISQIIKADWIDSYIHNTYGEIQRMQGDFAAAAESYRKGEALLRRQGDRGGEMPRIIHSQGYTALHLGNFDEAEEKFRESMEMFRKIGSRRGIAECLAGIAIVRAENGADTLGVMLLSAAGAAMKAFGGRWWPTDKMEIDRMLYKLRSSMDPDDFNTTWDKGQTLGLDAAVSLIKPQ